MYVGATGFEPATSEPHSGLAESEIAETPAFSALTRFHTFHVRHPSHEEAAFSLQTLQVGAESIRRILLVADSKPLSPRVLFLACRVPTHLGRCPLGSEVPRPYVPDLPCVPSHRSWGRRALVFVI